MCRSCALPFNGEEVRPISGPRPPLAGWAEKKHHTKLHVKASISVRSFFCTVASWRARRFALGRCRSGQSHVCAGPLTRRYLLAKTRETSCAFEILGRAMSSLHLPLPSPSPLPSHPIGEWASSYLAARKGWTTHGFESEWVTPVRSTQAQPVNDYRCYRTYSVVLRHSEGCTSRAPNRQVRARVPESSGITTSTTTRHIPHSPTTTLRPGLTEE